jgi:hypothetical protein
MPVSSYAVDDLFVFRVIKRMVTNPDRKWANTYEFRAVAAGSEDELLALGTALVEFEANMSLTATEFTRLIISTWVPDSVPYNPESFISTSLTASGGKIPGSDIQPLTMALSVARQVASGRFGHIFMRCVLQETDTVAPAGKSILVNRPAFQGLLNTAQDDAGLLDYIGLSPALGLQMVMVGKTDAEVRPVIGLAVQGVTQLPVDHTWYNRSAPA